MARRLFPRRDLSDTGPTPAQGAAGERWADMDESVRHEEEGGRGRFSLEAGGAEAELTYSLADGVMSLNHTFTPPAMRGHGVASRLMRAATAHARANGLKLRPVCSYAVAWMGRHGEEQDLLQKA